MNLVSQETYPSASQIRKICGGNIEQRVWVKTWVLLFTGRPRDWESIASGRTVSHSSQEERALHAMQGPPPGLSQERIMDKNLNCGFIRQGSQLSRFKLAS